MSEPNTAQEALAAMEANLTVQLLGLNCLALMAPEDLRDEALRLFKSHENAVQNLLKIVRLIITKPPVEPSAAERAGQ